jgi:hypothetical protein
MDEVQDLVSLIAADDQPYQITDKIKELLYLKSSNLIDQLKPEVAASLFKSEE